MTNFCEDTKNICQFPEGFSVIDSKITPETKTKINKQYELMK